MGFLRFFAIVFVVTAAVVVSPASPASAAAPTVCSYTEPVTGDVSGDVVVPPDDSCTLDDVQVHGTVTVAAQSRLYLNRGAHVDENVTIGLHGGLEVESGSSIAGDVALDYVGLFDMGNGAIISGDVRGTFEQHDEVSECDFAIENSVIHGDLDVSTSGELRYICLSQATVGGDVDLANAYLDIYASAVGGSATFTAIRSNHTAQARNGFAPSFVCATTFGGNLTLQDSLGFVLLGGDCPRGRLDIGGSLLINNNRNWVHVTAHVHGNVVCRGNTHHPIAGHPNSRHLQNIVDGHLLGQCAFLAVR